MGRPAGPPAHPLPGGELTWASALEGRSYRGNTRRSLAGAPRPAGAVGRSMGSIDPATPEVAQSVGFLAHAMGRPISHQALDRRWDRGARAARREYLRRKVNKC
jgi:hypothetical protein